MINNLKITKQLALVAFAIYVASLFLPYLTLLDPNYIEDISIEGYKILIFAIFVILIFISIMIKDSKTTKWLVLISSLLLLMLCMVFILYFESPSIRDLVGVYLYNGYSVAIEIGFFMCVFSSLLFFGAAVLKFKKPVPNKMHCELIDNFQND